MHEIDCDHLSATGIDQAEGDDKVWRCDACGWLYRSVRVEGQPPFVRVMVAATTPPHFGGSAVQ